MPEHCGPPIPFPPLNTTKSAPIFTKSYKLDFGGNWAAASTITGIPSFFPNSTTSTSCDLLCSP